jgi:multidrug resistance efflux pump
MIAPIGAEVKSLRTFSWVRLAQRIPVRIKLDNVPPDLLLVAGRTATVSIGKISWW